MNNFILYRHIRPDKDQVFYIGIGTHVRSASTKNRNKHWQNIVNSNNAKFLIDVMLDELTWKEACRMEKWWIAFYGRSDLQKGTLCNLTDGGEGNVNPCDEVRKKLSESKIGKKNPQYGKEHSEEWKTKQSAKLSGAGNPNYGKTLPNWQKEINRKAQLGRKHSIEHIENRIAHLRKKVVNTSTGTEYASVKEAAQLNKIAYRTMSRWATNNTNSFKLL
jgi:hypothetical protein